MDSNSVRGARDYGFLHFKVGWLEALGWKKGISLKISKNPDGSIMVARATSSSGYNCPRVKNVVPVKDLFDFLHYFYCFVV